QRPAAGSAPSAQAGGRAQPEEVPGAADPVTYAARGDCASSERDDRARTVDRLAESRRLVRPEPGLLLGGEDLRHRPARAPLDLLIEIDAGDAQPRREQRRHRALSAPWQSAEEHVALEEPRPLPGAAQRRL